MDWRANSNYYHDNDICPEEVDANMHNHVPMIWGKTTEIAFSQQPDDVLAYNEPNHQAQSNLTPQDAVDAYILLRDEVGGNVQFVSPSAAKCGVDDCIYGNTTAWFDEFFKLCGNYCNDITALATHTYWCNVPKTMAFLEDLHKTFNKQIWLTEVACAQRTDPEKILTFMKELLPKLEEATYVDRYVN